MITTIIGWLLFAVAPGHVYLCQEYNLEGTALVCLDNSVAYPEGHYRLVHDSDDGDIMQVRVWK